MEVMIPVWPQASGTTAASSNLASLKGSTVAFVDDNYDEEFAEEVELNLRETYGALVKRLLKPTGSAPSPKSLIEEAAQCRVAIVGIAL